MLRPLIKSFISLVFGISILRFKSFRFPVYIQKGLMVHNPKKIKLGKNVTIGRYARISSYGDNDITIGDNVYICHFFSILSGGKITIGDNTLIASYVAVISENHGMNPDIGIPYGRQNLVERQVSIGKYCWIGEKVLILPGVTIGDWSIIGAGSVVISDIPSYCIAVGNPAKVIKTYNHVSHSWEKV